MDIQFVSPAAQREFNDLPLSARENFAKALHDVQNGRKPGMSFKHLKTVGKGAVELIINGSPAFRTVYVAKYNDTLYILHSFTKTTNGTDLSAMKLAAKRYKQIPKDS